MEVVIKIEVKDNNVEQALRVLKRKLQRDGFFKIIKLKNNYEKPSEKKREFFKKILKELKNLISSKIGFSYRGVEQPGSCKAHNLEVGGSNPSPATSFLNMIYKLNYFRNI